MRTIQANVDLTGWRLRRLPKKPDGSWLFNDVIVRGYFSIDTNFITSLEGCPREVHGSFFCDENFLESLDGCPKVVTGDFWCRQQHKRFDIDYIRGMCEIAGNIRR